MKQRKEKLRERPTLWHQLKFRMRNLFRFQSKRKYKIEFEDVSPYGNTLTFKINNSSETDVVTARLFGSVKDLFNKKQSEFISVDVIESSHEELKLQILSETIFIKGMKICVKQNTQLVNQWSIYRQRMTGGTFRKPFLPFNFRHAVNNISNQVDAPEFELVVDKNTFIEIPMNPLEEMTIIFRIAAEFDFFQSIKQSFFRVYRSRKNKK